jgi:hypothetical protein
MIKEDIENYSKVTKELLPEEVTKELISDLQQNHLPWDNETEGFLEKFCAHADLEDSKFRDKKLKKTFIPLKESAENLRIFLHKNSQFLLSDPQYERGDRPWERFDSKKKIEKLKRLATEFENNYLSFIKNREYVIEKREGPEPKAKKGGLIFDEKENKFKYQGKEMRVMISEKSKSIRLNLCLLMFGHKATYINERARPDNDIARRLDICSLRGYYKKGDKIHVEELADLIWIKSDINIGENSSDACLLIKMASRKIRDAVEGLNTRSMSKFKIKIFRYKNQEVWVDPRP